jgi:hypothetical protein
LWWKESYLNRFLSSYFSIPFSIIPSIVNTHLHLHITLTRHTNRQTLGTFQKEILFQKLEKQWIEKYFHPPPPPSADLKWWGAPAIESNPSGAAI